MASPPTDVELRILNILWDQGRATARQVHESLQEIKETNYATTVKMLAVMLEKVLVFRDQSVRPQIYRAAVTRKATQKNALRDVTNRVFDGSLKSLVLQALSEKKHSTEELKEISEIIEQLKENEKKRKGR